MSTKERNPILWIPSLFFTDALPYVTLTLLCLVFYKRAGISHTEITIMGSVILLPWLFKSIVSESRFLRTAPRYFVLGGQCLIAIGFLGLEYTSGSWYKSTSLFMFLLISIGYTLHSSAADLLFNSMSSLKKARYIGIRTFFYHLGLIIAAGIFLMLVGGLETIEGKIPWSWSILYLIMAVVFSLSVFYHAFTLPYGTPQREEIEENVKQRIRKKRESLTEAFKELTAQKGGNTVLLFILLYRLPQALMMKITPLFLLDTSSKGGAALSTQELGLSLGTIGFIALAVGSVLGANSIKEKGLENSLKNMVLCMSCPFLGFLLISLMHVESFALTSVFVFLEFMSFGYGSVAYYRFIDKFSEGLDHYNTWCSIYMALGLILPGLISGSLQESMGYPVYFVFVIATGVISWFMTQKVISNIQK